jgi:SAM-dependent methyltransferase
MRKLKHRIRNIPLLGPTLAWIYIWIAERSFSDSASYWQGRYQRGGNSGDGSYGALASFKADVLNELIAEYAIDTVIEFGCGDGNQLMLARYPQYFGLDISVEAIAICKEKFHGDSAKTFCLMQDYGGEIADAAMSLDVLFHLVEDDVFERYMHTLFAAGRKLVIIYSSNTNVQETPQPPHVRHREFSTWVKQNAKDWSLTQVVDNLIPYDAESGIGSPANFYVYLKKTG